MNSPIAIMSKHHARAVAELHRRGIDTGFLSSLGLTFLKQLYKAIPSCPSGFGYVWQESNGEVLGFIACAESTGKVYKQALLRRGALMALTLSRFLLRPSVLKRMFETLRYPAELGQQLPAAEILSIVVAEHTRGRGIGKALVKAAFDEFSRRRIDRAKVAVGADNEAANRFYHSCGFELAATRKHHGLEMNIYVAETPGGMP